MFQSLAPLSRIAFLYRVADSVILCCSLIASEGQKGLFMTRSGGGGTSGQEETRRNINKQRKQLNKTKQNNKNKQNDNEASKVTKKGLFIAELLVRRREGKRNPTALCVH